MNAAILLSAWSAAASDVYISSRFLFFLAKCRHAPSFLAWLIRHPWDESQDDDGYETEEEDVMEVDDDELPVIDIRREDDNESLSSPRLSSSSSNPDESTALRRTISCAELGVSNYATPGVEIHITEVTSDAGDPVTKPAKKKAPLFVLPLAAVLVSSSVGLLSFLGTSKGSSSLAVCFMSDDTEITFHERCIGV